MAFDPAAQVSTLMGTAVDDIGPGIITIAGAGVGLLVLRLLVKKGWGLVKSLGARSPV